MENKKYNLEYCERADRCKNYCPYICDERCEFIDKEKIKEKPTRIGV